jgi:S-DNA-T family DNA segregation ATPase FtsK/SpoIIIE
MTETTDVTKVNGHGPIVSSQRRDSVAPVGAIAPGVWRGPQDITGNDLPAPIESPDSISAEDAPVPVDSDPRTEPSPLPWSVPGERRPVVPAWVLDSAQRRAAAAWAVRWTGHATLFHLIRVPKYAARTAYYSPRGAIRAVVWWGRWLFDLDAHGLRLDLIQKREAAHYYREARRRDDRVKNRAIGSLAAAVAAAVGSVAAWSLWSPAPLFELLAGLGALVWYGRPVGAPFIVDRTVTPTTVARLTSDIVARALASLGNGELRRAVERRELAFTAPIVRDGQGWRAEIDLPHGVTATDVIEKRAELSSGLRRPLGCVWPEPAELEHAGHLVLYVGDRPLAKMAPVPYPLLTSGTTSMFRPLPFGTDQRGRPVTVTLMFAAVAVGAQPRMGKTFSVRLFALGAALDVSCELHIFDGKGMGDYIMFESIAHWFGSGSREDVLLSLRDDLKALRAEVDRRAALLTKLTREGKCREGKVTEELAKVKAYQLHPILVLLDECHLAFDTGKGKAGALGEEITADAEYLVRVGPAAGISLVASTQRPDGDSLPTGIRANVQLRFCLRVDGQPTNDMVLGTGAYSRGVRATEFTMADKGIGYLSGEGAQPVIAWTHNVDADKATAIVGRARMLREDAGTISGMAAGIAPARTSDPAELLVDVLAALGEDDQAWSSAICERLAQAQPGRYAGWDAAALGKALRGLGVTTGQTWWTPPTGEAGNRNGVRREQITEALRQATQSKS